MGGFFFVNSKAIVFGTFKTVTTCPYTHTCRHAHTHTCTHECTHRHTHTHTGTHTQTRTHTHTHTHTHSTQAQTQTQTHTQLSSKRENRISSLDSRTKVPSPHSNSNLVSSNDTGKYYAPS